MNCGLLQLYNYRSAQLISRSQDLIVRYTLVATPKENAVMQNQCLLNETRHLAPVNLDDHRATADLLIQRLSSSDQHDLFSASHAAFMLLQFAAALRIQEAYSLCIPVMQTGLQFFWRVCLHPERREEIWDKDGPYALQPVVLFKCVENSMCFV